MISFAERMDIRRKKTDDNVPKVEALLIRVQNKFPHVISSINIAAGVVHFYIKVPDSKYASASQAVNGDFSDWDDKAFAEVEALCNKLFTAPLG